MDPLTKVEGPTLERNPDIEKGQPLECAVCLQTCVHPVQLQCRHIFCFLCVKGVAIQSKRCPMCRREIPQDYLEHPDLVQGSLELALASEEVGVATVDDSEEPKAAETRWFYEGRNGWWEYDFRTGQELEHFFKEGESTCEMLIAGFLYTIDFTNMLQYRRNEPNRRRRIKRDLLSNIQNWKGVAGLRLATAQSSSTDDASQSTADQLSDNLASLTLGAGALPTSTRVRATSHTSESPAAHVANDDSNRDDSDSD